MLLQQDGKSCRLRRTVVGSRDRNGSKDDNYRRMYREGSAGSSSGNGHTAWDAGHGGGATGERNDSPTAGGGPAQRDCTRGKPQRTTHNSRGAQRKGGHGWEGRGCYGERG